MFRLGYDERQCLIVSMCGQVRMEGVGLMHKSHSEERGTGFLPIIEKKELKHDFWAKDRPVTTYMLQMGRLRLLLKNFSSGY